MLVYRTIACLSIPSAISLADISEMLDDNLMAVVFPEMDPTQRLRVLAKVLTSRRFVVLVDELDELSGTVLSRFYQFMGTYGSILRH